MTEFKTFILITVILICFNSCAEDKDCDDYYIIDKMMFFNADLNELNNIEILGYKQGSDFKEIIDSSYRVIRFEDNSTTYLEFTGELNKDLRTDLDYKVLFNLSNRYCDITEIKVKENICNAKLFNSEYSKSFDGYLVNGGEFACQIIKIFPK